MTLSPMMKQYQAAKDSCGDALLLFRMGDFYELFYHDAEVAARTLGLTLTSRDKKTNPVPMAGFPHHQLDGYLSKLIAAGYRVAVCEQVEDPKATKGLVKREVTRVVTPGTVIDQTLLDPRNANYLAAILGAAGDNDSKGQPIGIAWLDLSTGAFFAAQGTTKQVTDLAARIQPRELLFSDAYGAPTEFFIEPPLMTSRPAWTFNYDKSSSSLCHQFRTKSLEGFGFDSDSQSAIAAAGAILEYLKETQKSELDHINCVLPFRMGETLEIDLASWRSLEITQNSRTLKRDGSLLGVIDRTMTSMGARMLGEWVSAPLKDVNTIHRRLDSVEEFTQNQTLRSDIREQFKNVFDLQRLLSRVVTGRATPRELSHVGTTLALMPTIKSLIEQCQSSRNRALHQALDLCEDLRLELESALVEDCPPSTKDGGFIRPGYHSELDELRALASGGKKWIAEYQAKIIEESEIPSLKVGFNKVFGYYLEVTNTHRDKVPDYFIRKQTLKNAERFITPELKEYEEKVLSADDKAQELELQLFQQLREKVRNETNRLKSNSEIIAEVDVYAGLAELATSQNYCRPEINDNVEIAIVQGRHPVLDVVEPEGTFVPNDTIANGEDGLLHLITGPNMAGKSTYIRQVALLTVLAQAGSFVPAESATIGVADQIFARIGASDELSRGQSTFMVEMNETARILNTATNRSLVILDEIGRGTSTYDGVSLAWSIVEFLHDQIGCRTLFATHYHELTQLDRSLEYVRNFNVRVKEWQDEIVFLHRIEPGAADKSYGIHVSRLAGVPPWVSERAEAILKKLETEPDAHSPLDASHERSKNESGVQMTLFEMVDHPLIEKIKRIDPNHVTPLDALQMIGQWKEELEDANGPRN